MRVFHHVRRVRLGLFAIAVLGVILLAGCGSSKSSSSSSSAAPSASSSSATSSTSSSSTSASTRHLVVRAQAWSRRHRHSDPARCDQHQAARHGLHGHPEHGGRVLRLRQRQWRSQRSPDQAVQADRADATRADRRGCDQTDPDRSRGRDLRHLEHPRVHDQPCLLGEAPLLRDRGRHRAGVLFDSEHRRREHGTAVQLRRRRAVRPQPASVEDRVRSIQRPRDGLHRRRPGGAGGSGPRADHAADRERADQRCQLGGAEGGRRRRPERRGGAELHSARGARDPPGCPEAGPRGPGQGVGLLDSVRRRLPGKGAGTEVEPQVLRQLGGPEPGHRRTPRT